MKKAIISALCAVLAVILASCSFGMQAVYPNAEKYTAGNASFTEKIEKIDVDWSSGEVKIVQSDTDKVIVEESSQSLTDDEKVHWMLDGTTLRIKFCASGTIIDPLAEKELTLTVPSGLALLSLDASCASAPLYAQLTGADEVNLSSASGKISANLSDVGKVLISSASGAMSADITNAGSLELSTASGKVEALLTGEVGELEADSASGNITVNGEAAKEASLETSSGKITASFEKTPDTLDIETSSGNVSLTLPEDASFKAEVDTASGSFDCAFPTIRNGDTYICGDGKSDISFDTASGDISIFKAN